MIRKAYPADMQANDPTPDQIRLRSEAIRKTWSPRERARRLSVKQAVWMPPSFAESELPSWLSGDYDGR